MANTTLKSLPPTPPMPSNGIVAQNLLIARTTLGWAQQRLANASGISRATIVQLEAGLCDPRLSTIEMLARAMHISTAFLMFNENDFRAISELPADKPHSHAERRSMEALDRASDSPHYRSRLEAALKGVDIATQAGLTSAAQLIGAAIGSARLASRGTFVGANLAHLMDYYSAHGRKSHTHGDDAQFAENI